MDLKAPSHQERLNPFAFPPETNVRFTLLIIASLTLTWYLAHSLGAVTGALAPLQSPGVPADLADPTAVEQSLLAWSRTLLQLLWNISLPAAAVLLVLLLALIVYLTYPARIRRQKRLKQLSLQQDAPFLEAVHHLARQHGVLPVPAVEVGGDPRAIDGQAFGLPGRYRLRLGGGLRLALRKQPQGFRAVVLHELAHIANQDVWRTYFAQSIWIATVVTIFLPVVAYLFVVFSKAVLGKLPGGISGEELRTFFFANLPVLLTMLLQFTAILAFITAIRSSLLRVREVYADWRAALWGAAAPLAAILRRRAAQESPGWGWGLWKLHPPARERLALLADPNQLFRLSNALPLLVGVLLAFLLDGAFLVLIDSGSLVTSTSIVLPLLALSGMAAPVSFLVGLLLVFEIIAWLLVLGVGTALVYLVAGSLGLQVQREAVADLFARRSGVVPYLELGKPALFAAIGFQLGAQSIPFKNVLLLPGLAPGTRLLALGSIIAQTVGAACMAWLWLCFVRYFALRTLGAHTGQKPPHGSRRMLTLASSFLLLALSLPTLVFNLIMTEFGAQAGGGEPANLGNWGIILAGSILVSLLLYAVLFGLLWTAWQVGKRIGTRRCPVCQEPNRQPLAAGERCTRCGSALASWALIQI